MTVETEIPEEIIILEDEAGNLELLEIVEVEIYVKEQRPVPHARKYKIRIDKHHYETEKHELTGTEILDLASKKPESWKLYEHKHGHQPSLVGPVQVVNLHTHCVERFTTMPKDTQEG
ncbi:MAG: multiubiquitin domain-containing protein [Ktedonobacteraceae bacterium]|nr:multiubiquitin domain-containing protein [Ktedonobacteraceae bacterium]